MPYAGHFAEFGIVAAQGARNVRLLLAIIQDENNTDLPAGAQRALQPLASTLVDIET